MAGQDQPVYSIGAVARMTGIPAATLRAWEQRYAVIAPTRSDGAQRLYTRSDVERLRYIKAQLEAGMSAADAHRLLTEELRAGHLPAAPGGAATDRRPLILIAEPDPYAAGLAEYFLRTEGWEVVIALDATQATLHFEEQSPDIVLIDMLISGGAGFRLVGEFSAQQKAQIVAVSAIDSAEEAMRAGAAAFLIKPVESLALLSTVRDLLGTSALVREAEKQRSRR